MDNIYIYIYIACTYIYACSEPQALHSYQHYIYVYKLYIFVAQEREIEGMVCFADEGSEIPLYRAPIFPFSLSHGGISSCTV